METKKTSMIAALKSVLVKQGYPIVADFEERAGQLSLAKLAIEISLAQAGI